MCGSFVPTARRYGARIVGLLAAATLCGCGDLFVSVIQSESPPYETIVDEFLQTDLPGRDILWIVDSTSSMAGELSTLSQLFDSFIGVLDAYDISYQVGVTTTDLERDEGRLVGTIPIITRHTQDAALVFQDNIALVIDNLTSLSQEKGLEVSRAALAAANLSDGGANYGFLRASAGLTVVVVSDSDDKSEGDVADYADFLRSLKAGTDLPDPVQFLAIVGIPGSTCLGTVPGYRYIALAEDFDSKPASLCAQDVYAEVLGFFGLNQVTLQASFPLSHLPVEGGGLLVSVDGQILDEGTSWVFRAETQMLEFLEGQEPPYGSLIRVVYQTREEP